MKKTNQSQTPFKTGRSLTVILSILWLCQISQAQAALSVTVTGDALGGGSTWVFNGTTTVGTGNSLSGDQDNGNINAWFHSPGELSLEIAEDSVYNDSFFVGYTIESGGVSGSLSGMFTFDGLLLNSDSVVGGDDFGWLIGNQSAHTFVTGETITYDNYTLVTDLDITTFGEENDSFIGTQTIENNGDMFTTSSTTEPIGGLSLKFIASPVPEPSSAALLGFGGFALITRRRRG